MPASCPEITKSQMSEQSERSRIIGKLRRQLEVIRQAMVATFDASDIDYLAVNFSTRELRQLISHAEVEASTCRCFDKDVEEGYWREVARAARSALDVQLWLRSGVITRTVPGRNTMDVQALKDRVDIADVVANYVPLKKTGRTFLGLCPFHSEKHPSFYVYPERQSWHCFGCNRGGDVISFVMGIEHVDFLGALAILGNGHGSS